MKAPNEAGVALKSLSRYEASPNEIASLSITATEAQCWPPVSSAGPVEVDSVA